LRNGILFSAGLADKDRVHIIDELLTALNQNLPDADYFVGINTDSCKGTCESIRQHVTPVAMEIVPATTVVKSDVSGYQLAMKLLKESNRRYDLYWFIHSKGGYHNRDGNRKFYIDRFIGKAQEIRVMFSQFPGLGSYGLRGVAKMKYCRSWKNYKKDHILDICGNIQHDEFKFTHVNWSYMETIYALRGEAINHFLDITPDSYFSSRIKDPCYFETVIPWIPTRMGFFPYVENKKCFWKRGDLNKITRKWIRKNKLECEEFDHLLTLKNAFL
jgi:hypothetical protein